MVLQHCIISSRRSKGFIQFVWWFDDRVAVKSSGMHERFKHHWKPEPARKTAQPNVAFVACRNIRSEYCRVDGGCPTASDSQCIPGKQHFKLHLPQPASRDVFLLHPSNCLVLVFGSFNWNGTILLQHVLNVLIVRIGNCTMFRIVQVDVHVVH